MKKKVAFGVLIALLIVLTFLSKSLYNYRLPEITAARPGQGKLVFTLQGESELEYAKTRTVYAEADGRVGEIYVKPGDRVKPGQEIMGFEPEGEKKTEKITADRAGIIVTVGVQPGMYVSYMQNTVMYITAEESGEWVCALPMDEEQRRQVDKKSTVTVNFPDSGQPAKGKIRDIVSVTEEEQGQKGYQAEISLHSDKTGLAGARVGLTIRKESGEYDTMIPTPALRKDSKGYYVLLMEREDSVLGAGYVAERRAVELLDSDEEYCAVRGVSNDDQVITAATDEIEEGSRVYYVEEETQDEDE